MSAYPERHSDRPPHPEAGSCIALVDARFLHWLHASDDDDDEDDDGRQEPAAALRQRLPEVLGEALRAQRLHARVVRVYWYTSVASAPALNGQVLRLVPPEAADGGASLALAMARDALHLAETRACAHLLIASDDDRLLATVDAVQARGLRVHLLADRSAADLERLAKSDAGWASLLRQADTRLVVDNLDRPSREAGWPGAAEGRAWGPRERQERAPRREAVAHSQAIVEWVDTWLARLSEPTRELLQSQLPAQRGLPQEADRELLLQISQQLGRPLSVPERKLMREHARQGLAGPAREGPDDAGEDAGEDASAGTDEPGVVAPQA